MPRCDQPTTSAFERAQPPCETEGSPSAPSPRCGRPNRRRWAASPGYGADAKRPSASSGPG